MLRAFLFGGIMIVINGVEYETFNEDGEEIHTKSQYEGIFNTSYYDFFRILDYQYGIKLEENWDSKTKKDRPYIRADNGKRFSPNYYTLSHVYSALLNECRSQRNDSTYKFINDYDNYVLEMINHPLLEKYRNQYHPKNKLDTKHENKNERVFLYHFMKDFGRFPNQEEETEYQKSFTEKEVGRMVEIYQKSLKKTKRS